MREPIIILGAARSGTKILRDVLASSASIKAVPYDVSYIWRHGNEGHAEDTLRPEHAGPRQKAFVRKHLARIAGISEHEDVHLLEKTVGNTLRPGFVKMVYPNAKFIHLVRDGRAVTESAMRTWTASPNYRSLFKKVRTMPISNIRYTVWFARNTVRGMLAGRRGGAVWGPRYQGIFEDAADRPLVEVCARQWAHSVRSVAAEAKEAGPGKLLTIRYEDFVRDQDALIRLLEFLDLPDRDAVMRSYSESVVPESLDKWRHVLDEGQIKAIESIGAQELREFGYV